MDYLVGITGKDFVLIAADCSQTRSVIRMKSDMDKMMPVSSRTLLLLAGPVGDCTNFGDSIKRNMKLRELQSGYEASPHAIANYVRNSLAESLRTKERYQCDLLVAGFDEKNGSSLYYIDNLAAMAKVPYSARGYGGFFTLATLDRHYQPDMDIEQAKDVLRKCILEVRTRFMVAMPAFKVRIITKDGIEEITDVDVQA